MILVGADSILDEPLVKSPFTTGRDDGDDCGNVPFVAHSQLTLTS